MILEKLGNLNGEELFDFVSKNGKIKDIVILRKKSVCEKKGDNENE